MRILSFALLLVLWSCRSEPTSNNDFPNQRTNTPIREEPLSSFKIDTIQPKLIDYDSNIWTDINYMDSSILMDIRYATRFNFVEEIMYECGRCFLRKEVALAVGQIQEALRKEGLGLKMFDCYRPRPIQRKLWEKVPDPRYVADPEKGSMHNRGAAVDLTIVDLEGNELDMGTAFDYFGPKAYHNYSDHPQEVLDNRKKLKGLMEAHGFRPTSTEWWHYSYRLRSYDLSDWIWECP